ncbi:DUF4178 domain-containing protein [Allonocardiopsis opalescens]|uniref:DUF4178 domain-containing protein n=1 Tax=Allonocardiopsis opalescens TaxID=1144618 RepID=UPI003CCBE011
MVVLLVIAALVAVIVVLLRQRRAAEPQARPPAVPSDPFADTGTGGDPRSLKAGDMVEYLGDRSWVRGSLRLSEGGSTWSEHFLDLSEQGSPKRWLSVEEDPDLQLAMWTSLPESDLTPHSPVLEFEGVTYRLQERGTASYRSEGTTGLRPQGGMDYADYEAPDGRQLSFERFDHGRWEPSLGTPVPNGSLTIYPGS